MNAVLAALDKTLKTFFRDKAIISSSIFVPTFFLLMMPLMMYSDVPIDLVPFLKGSLTIAMTSLLTMSVGMANFTGAIVADEERGLFAKLSSMPVKPWKECIGRIMGAIIFSFLGGIFLVSVGISYGAGTNAGLVEILVSVFFGLMIAVCSIGVGLIIASLIKGESAATHVGVAISILFYFIGIAMPYWMLPSFLEIFARYCPITAANNMMIYLIEGEMILGYNPLNFLEITSIIVFSFAILIIGIMLYSRYCWRKV
jgi:ABC-type multidrug transport system permease subunit